MTIPALKLLFLCTHNACRSILCEAVTRKVAEGRIEVASAGSHPAGQIHPLTSEQLLVRGYSLDGLHSKSVEALASFEPDAVITVCNQAASETCPVWLGRATKVHWGLPDPSQLKGTTEEVNQAFSDVIDKIEGWINLLLEKSIENAGARKLAEILNQIGEQKIGEQS